MGDLCGFEMVSLGLENDVFELNLCVVSTGCLRRWKRDVDHGHGVWEMLTGR